MASFKDPGFQERTASANDAKLKALEKLRAKPAIDPAVVAERAAARAAKEELPCLPVWTTRSLLTCATLQSLPSHALGRSSGDATRGCLPVPGRRRKTELTKGGAK